MASRFLLDNGLTVVFDEQRVAKVAAFQVWVKAGSADERADQIGLAHLHEHMLFKGTKRRGPGEIAHDIEAHGGEINAWTSFDQTVYHIVIASQFARLGLDALADAVRESAFDPGELEREIEVVCEEIKRSQDIPARRASKDLFATAYLRHPYQRPVIGWEEAVRAHTREGVLDFYRRHYAPSNMVLSVAGDLSLAQVRGWAEELFGGDWGRPPSSAPPRPQEPPLEATRILLRADEVKEAYLNLSFPAPSVSHPDAPALDLLAMIAGQGEASRLVMQVKRKRSLVNEIHAYAYTPKDPGLMAVSMTLPAANAEAALEEAARVLAQLRTNPVGPEELATVKALMESEAVYQRETVQGLARKLGYFESAAGGIEEEARYYERIAALTAEEILAAARRYLTLERAVVTGLLPLGATLSAERVKGILAAAAGESPPAPKDRKVPRGERAPLQVTAPIAARGGTSGIIVERLASGASVIIREESAVPLFAMRAVFPGGLRYEAEDTNGLTTLLARNLTRGTPSRDAEEISHLIDDMAGSLAGAGGRNSVSLRGEFLSKHFDRAFGLFADCLLHPSFPEGELERERRLLLQDIHTREDKPSGVAFDLFTRALFSLHPYRLNNLGEAASVERLARSALGEYHSGHLDPSQLTLCVVGDVKAERVMALAHEAFGRSFGKAVPPPEVPLEPAPAEPRRAHQQLARAQTHLVYGFQGVRVTDRSRRALEVLSTVLSGQGGRLFVELRDRRSMAYSVSSLTVEGVDPGYFAVYIGTSPEKAESALEAIRAELSRLVEEPVSAQELRRAQQHLIGVHEIGLQRNGARAALMALDHCYGIGAEAFLSYAGQIQSVTAEQVLEVARRIIDHRKSALAIVGP
ncbi:MAG: insulinase family protein [Myxococcales bacterium]|nr:insulinase family protein [Myxococcales bacterium]